MSHPWEVPYQPLSLTPLFPVPPEAFSHGRQLPPGLSGFLQISWPFFLLPPSRFAAPSQVPDSGLLRHVPKAALHTPKQAGSYPIQTLPQNHGAVSVSGNHQRPAPPLVLFSRRPPFPGLSHPAAAIRHPSHPQPLR